MHHAVLHHRCIKAIAIHIKISQRDLKHLPTPFSVNVGYIHPSDLQIQPLHHFFELIIRNAQIPLGVGQTRVVELVHDERQVYAIHASVVAPGLAQAMCSKVAT